MAIKVSGTNVITDARALNNITSVDSTTAAAIGNAGVGGGISLLQTTTVSGTPTYIDYNFPTGYENFMVVFSKLKNNTTSAYNYSEIGIQYKNSSGSLITSYDYKASEYNSTGMTNRQFHILGYVGLNIFGVANTTITHFFNPRRSDVATSHRSHSMGDFFVTDSSNNGYPLSISGTMNTAQDTSGIRIYMTSGGTGFANTGKILFFGMK